MTGILGILCVEYIFIRCNSLISHSKTQKQIKTLIPTYLYFLSVFILHWKNKQACMRRQSLQGFHSDFMDYVSLMYGLFYSWVSYPQ